MQGQQKIIQGIDRIYWKDIRATWTKGAHLEFDGIPFVILQHTSFWSAEMPSTSHQGTKRAGKKQRGKTENLCRDKGYYKDTRRGYEFYLRVLYLSPNILYKI